MEEYWRQFLTDNEDGKMNKKEFIKYLNQVYPEKDIAKIADHIFQVFDLDKNGKIEFAEFALVYHTLKTKAGKEKLKEFFRVFDVNDNGFITREEMKRLVKNMYALLKFANPDVVAEKTIEDLAFSEMDKNGDGVITEKEFENAIEAEAEFTIFLTEEVDNLLFFQPFQASRM